MNNGKKGIVITGFPFFVKMFSQHFVSMNEQNFIQFFRIWNFAREMYKICPKKRKINRSTTSLCFCEIQQRKIGIHRKTYFLTFLFEKDLILVKTQNLRQDSNLR